MPNRTPFVGGNWKMNTDARSGSELASSLASGLAGTAGVEVAIFPPLVYLREIGSGLATSDILLGAQDVYDQPDGAFTGEISIDMLNDCGVRSVLTGHSERRHVIGESDTIVNRKTRAVLDAGLQCVLCIGETLDQRESGKTDAINEHQTRAGLEGVSKEQLASVVIAYEPVWAIGTGKVAGPADAQEVCAALRATLAELYSDEVAGTVRVLYGGSVKSSNVGEIVAQTDVDGALVGGASLDAEEFAKLSAIAAGGPLP